MQSNLVKLCESMAEGEKKLKEGDEEIAEMEKKRDKASENRVLLLIIWIQGVKQEGNYFYR